NVRLPHERAVLGLSEDQFQSGGHAVLRLQFPIVVVIAEPNALIGKAGGQCAELTSERAPAGCVHCALLRRNGGHEQLMQAELSAGCQHLVRSLPQCSEADMRGTEPQSACVGSGPDIRCVIQMRAYAFDITEPCGSSCIQHLIEVIERTQRIELD